MGIDLIVANVNMSFEWIMIMLIAVGGLIFYAKGATVGMMMHMIGFALLFVWFYEAGYLWANPLILMCIMLVLLSFTLYFSSRQTQGATFG